MDSSRSHNYHHQNSQPSSGLLRFRSTPSSVLANFADNGLDNDAVLNFQDFEDKSPPLQSSSGLPPHYPVQNSSATSSLAMDGSYALIGSMGMSHHEQAKKVDSSLSSQNSSPAGNGYATIKGLGNYAGVNGTNGAVSPRLQSQLSFSPRGPSSLGILSQIAEIGSEGIGTASPDGGKHGNGNIDSRFYSSPGFPHVSWSDSNFAENFSAVKRDQDNNVKPFSNSQNGGLGNHFHLISHRFSLPKSSVEMVSMDKFLHFQDSVPCKIRAKRGCATHPRSIAERVRRTRISERMRKLQELVPNMDKQTNTADMLDLAVDYIKDLQKQYKTLRDNRANCKCLSEQNPVQSSFI